MLPHKLKVPLKIEVGYEEKLPKYKVGLRTIGR
jgi:hypothetical protein